MSSHPTKKEKEKKYLCGGEVAIFILVLGRMALLGEMSLLLWVKPKTLLLLKGKRYHLVLRFGCIDE
jgi:hypothetical protein